MRVRQQSLVLTLLVFNHLFFDSKRERRQLQIQTSRQQKRTSRLAEAGYALMGGGSDLDEAFRYLCEKGKGGDFLILRVLRSADYNPYIKKLCKRILSALWLFRIEHRPPIRRS
jgi:hypothetical protein